MKKRFFLTATIFLFLSVYGITASAAVVNETAKVGLYYGENALYSANLENRSGYGSGYYFGYYDASRNFQVLGQTEHTQLSVTGDGTIGYDGSGVIQENGYSSQLGGYHLQLGDAYMSYEQAQQEAERWAYTYDQAFVAYVAGNYFVRLGAYFSAEEAAAAQEMLYAGGVSAGVAAPSATGVTVTKTREQRILFQFDYSGIVNFALLPKSTAGEKTITWFKNYRYYGGFEYVRITGSRLNVINVLPLEDYVKCVIPYEMSASWPLEALKAQAVCARTYISKQNKHDRAYGFDVCNTTDCQVYYGTAATTADSDAAVDSTRGQMGYYNGTLASMVYSSCDGGATESAENVWGSPYPYLVGKLDPYEALVSSQISKYSWSVSYSAQELTWILQQKNYSIGTICNVFVSEYTPTGNVKEITFQDTVGTSLVVTGSTCRSIFSSATYGKSVPSMRFSISGGSSGQTYSVNEEGAQVSSGQAWVTTAGGGSTLLSGKDLYVITSNGVEELTSGGAPVPAAGGFTIYGTGSGHNVGMSQWGAYAMAKQGFSYREILEFYYTNLLIM